MTEPYAVLVTALTAAAALTVLIALLWAATVAALWRTRRQRDTARRRAARQQTRIRHQRQRIAGYLAELNSLTEATRPRTAAWALDQPAVIPGTVADPEQVIEAALVCLTEAELLDRHGVLGSAGLSAQAFDKLRQLDAEQLVEALALALGGEALERADMVEQVPADATSLLDGGDR